MSLNHKRRIFRSSFPFCRGAIANRVGRWGAAALAVAAFAGVCVWAGGSWTDFGFPAATRNAVDTKALTERMPLERMVADASAVAVVDGNTLRMADRVVRLEGVIPPARGETCVGRDGSSFDCGVAAANALAAMLRQGSVDCTLVGADRNGRPRASCSSGGEWLNRAVVAQGWARAADDTLLAAEQSARSRQVGLWVMAR